MNDLETAFSLANLRRAYKWILSNPDARYKNLFRDSYSAYALASDSNLRRLRQDLLSGHYEASHASKLFLPKPSGTLRPITLLTTDDQIVYAGFIGHCSSAFAKNGAATRRLKHSDYRNLRPALVKSFDEIETNVVL